MNAFSDQPSDPDLDQCLPNGMTLREFLEKSLSGKMRPAGEYRGG